MTTIKNILKYPVYFCAYIVGGLTFFFTRKTPNSAYTALRFFFVKSHGKANNFISNFLGFFIKKYDIKEANGILGNLSAKDIDQITAQIQKDGFYIFDTKLSEAQMTDIVSFSKQMPSKYIDLSTDIPRYHDELTIVDEDHVISPRYQFQKSDLVTNHTIMNLATDSSILAIAQSYLGCKPVLDKITMWWSFPFNKKGTSAAAQMYHFDMDRIKFIKFFFYLTDVHNENGPHCYVKNSHQYRPKSVNSDGRKTDEEIAQAYPKENLLEICGKKGTILAVDTSGFHKGKPLTMDKRLLFQLELCNTLFGTIYETVKLPDNTPKEILQQIEKYKYTYNQILKTP